MLSNYIKIKSQWEMNSGLGQVLCMGILIFTIVFFPQLSQKVTKKLSTGMKWYQELFFFSGNITKFSIVNDGLRLNRWSVLLMLCKHLFVDTTKNACIIHTTKLDRQLHHTPISNLGFAQTYTFYFWWFQISNSKALCVIFCMLFCILWKMWISSCFTDLSGFQFQTTHIPYYCSNCGLENTQNSYDCT